MAENKQTQKAGDNSQQIQAGTVNVYNGLSETRVRQIYSEMSVRAKEEYTAEAYQTIEKRIADFENKLIPRIEKIENGFEAFADPEFQVELKKAQVASACTDKEADYEMLSELLLHRIENKDNRRAKASISKAVEIVDKIEDDGLCGLTVVYLAEKISVNIGEIRKGLSVLNDAFSNVINTDLPTGNSWISYLDILDVIRASDFSEFRKFEDYYFDRFNGYSSVGIFKNSSEYEKAIGYLESVNLNEQTLIDHELLEGYVRLPLTILGDYSNLTKTVLIPNFPFSKQIKLSDNEISALNNIVELYSRDQTKKDEVKSSFFDLLNSFDSLRMIKDWWDVIPNHFTITPIGQVLAHANAQRYIEIPDIKF